MQKYEILLEKTAEYETRNASNCYEVYQACKDMRLDKRDREYFVTFALDSKNNIIGVNETSVGTINGSLVSPANVIKFALLANAASIIVAHNHPSGSASPSEQDVKATKKLKKACKLMYLPLLDHIIVGEDNYYSFKDGGNI